MKLNVTEDGEKIITKDVKEYYFPEEIPELISLWSTALSDAKEIKKRVNEIQQIRKKYNGAGKGIEDIFDPRD